MTKIDTKGSKAKAHNRLAQFVDAWGDALYRAREDPALLLLTIKTALNDHIVVNAQHIGCFYLDQLAWTVNVRLRDGNHLRQVQSVTMASTETN